MRFYLGGRPAWLADPRADFPLFVSHRELARLKTHRPSTHPWALDSGAFTEISMHGTWTITAREYAEAVARYVHEIGHLDWAAPMDRMVEPWILAKIRQTCDRHQHLTVDNYLELREIWPQVSDRPCPFRPSLQGWTLGDYLRCEDMYAAAGVDLAKCDLVGLGSVCRRQNTLRIGQIVSMFSDRMPLHAFGCKTEGLRAYGDQLASADSMAWSYDACRSAPMPGCKHGNCNGCLVYAADWRADLLDRVAA